MKQQLLVVHGGDTFENYEDYLYFLQNFQIDLERLKSKEDWKTTLQKRLGDEYEVFLPSMPNKTFANYDEWKIWMDKISPLLQDDVILIGHSLGGVFWAKYLSTTKFPKKIKAVFLVAAPFEKDSENNSLAGFTLPMVLDMQTDKIYLYHSKDDSIVSFEELFKYKKALPKAVVRELDLARHFNQEYFPDLLEDIKKLQ